VVLIEKNTSNTVIFTLAEKTTLTSVVYLFELTSDESQEVKCFIATDISGNPERYNEFLFIENVTEDLLNGTFSLTLNGFYEYNVYEQSSTTNLDPTLATNLIETGKLKCFEDIIANPVYTGNQTNTVVYNGNQ
jgi:hypothetical protein